MADDLKRSERTVAPEVQQDRPLARVQAVPWLIVIVLLAAVAWLGWRAFFYQEEGDPVGGYLPSGSVAGVIGDRPTCEELIERLVAEAERTLQQLAN